MLLLLAFLSLPGLAGETVAYWRFEDGVPGQVVSPGTSVADLSGNGNSLRAFGFATAPSCTATVPFPVTPRTGEPNRAALDSTAAPGRGHPTRDLFCVHVGDGTDLNQCEFLEWTIEATVLFAEALGWERLSQTFVGRDGYNVSDASAVNEDLRAALYLRKRGDSNRLSIETYDADARCVVVQSREPVKPGHWYSVAAVCNGRELVLYVKGPDDEAYVRQDSAPFRGAMLNNGGTWTVGRGFFGNLPADQHVGLIDEVRISRAALSPADFLASPGSVSTGKGVPQ
jgi:hypothetical protein